MTKSFSKWFRKQQIVSLSHDPQLASVKDAMELALNAIDGHSRTELKVLNYLIHTEVKGVLGQIADQAVRGELVNIAHVALADTFASLGIYVSALLAGEVIDALEDPETATLRDRVNATFRYMQEVVQTSLSTALPREMVDQAKALRAAVDARMAAGQGAEEALRAVIESGEVVVSDGVRAHLLGDHAPAPVAKADDNVKIGQYL